MTKLLKGYFAFIGALPPRDDDEDDTFVIPTEDEAFDVVMVGQDRPLLSFVIV